MLVSEPLSDKFSSLAQISSYANAQYLYQTRVRCTTVAPPFVGTAPSYKRNHCIEN